VNDVDYLTRIEVCNQRQGHTIRLLMLWVPADVLERIGHMTNAEMIDEWRERTGNTATKEQHHDEA
jgi:hypothetical protein